MIETYEDTHKLLELINWFTVSAVPENLDISPEIRFKRPNILSLKKYSYTFSVSIFINEASLREISSKQCC